MCMHLIAILYEQLSFGVIQPHFQQLRNDNALHSFHLSLSCEHEGLA